MADEGGLAITQKTLQAGANILFAAEILKPDVDPQKVMVTLAHMLVAMRRIQPVTVAQARDIDPELVKKIEASRSRG